MLPFGGVHNQFPFFGDRQLRQARTFLYARGVPPLFLRPVRPDVAGHNRD